MKLIVNDLNPSTYQTVRRSKNTIVEAVRPHIYRHLWPSGSIRVVIEDSIGNTVSEGEWVSIADIGTQNYFHGYVRLYVNAYLRKDTDYRIKIEAGEGYSHSPTAFVSAVNGYDLGKYEPTYESSDWLAPLDLEIWERKT